MLLALECLNLLLQRLNEACSSMLADTCAEGRKRDGLDSPVLSQVKNLLNDKPKDLQRHRGVLVDRDARVEHVVRFESVTAGPADRVAFVVSFEINKNLRPADLENVVEQWAD